MLLLVDWSVAQHSYGSKTTGLRHHAVEYGSTQLWKQDNRTETPWSGTWLNTVMEARQLDWDTTDWSTVWLRHHWLKKYSSTQLRKQDKLTETPLAIKQSHKITTWSRQQPPTKLRPSSHKDRTLLIFCCWSCHTVFIVGLYTTSC